MTTPIPFPPALPCHPDEIPATIALSVRGYPHFDFSHDAVEVFWKFDSPSFYWGGPNFVSTHSFLPFISYDIVSHRWDKDKKEKIEKVRTVAYASHRDAVIFQYYAQMLSWYYEQSARYLLDGCVIAYRAKGKTNIDYAFEAFTHIKDRGNCVVHALDLKDFFGSLDHGILKNRWAALLGRAELPADHYAVFKALAKYTTLKRSDICNVLSFGKRRQKKLLPRICSVEDFKEKIRPSVKMEKNKFGRGIVQGSPISACASNIYMMEFDRTMQSECLKLGAYYRRYSDDLLLVCDKSEETRIISLLHAEVDKHKLRLHDTKCVRTEVVTGSKLNNPIQYLGFIYDGERILIRPSSIARYWRKMKLAVRRRRFCVSCQKKAGISALIYKGPLLKKYTHFGKKENFPAYVKSSYNVIGDLSIRRQIRRHVSRLSKFIKERY